MPDEEHDAQTSRLSGPNKQDDLAASSLDRSVEEGALDSGPTPPGIDNCSARSGSFGSRPCLYKSDSVLENERHYVMQPSPRHGETIVNQVNRGQPRQHSHPSSPALSHSHLNSRLNSRFDRHRTPQYRDYRDEEGSHFYDEINKDANFEREFNESAFGAAGAYDRERSFHNVYRHDGEFKSRKLWRYSLPSRSSGDAYDKPNPHSCVSADCVSGGDWIPPENCCQNRSYGKFRYNRRGDYTGPSSQVGLRCRRHRHELQPYERRKYNNETSSETWSEEDHSAHSSFLPAAVRGTRWDPNHADRKHDGPYGPKRSYDTHRSKGYNDRNEHQRSYDVHRYRIYGERNEHRPYDIPRYRAYDRSEHHRSYDTYHYRSYGGGNDHNWSYDVHRYKGYGSGNEYHRHSRRVASPFLEKTSALGPKRQDLPLLRGDDSRRSSVIKKRDQHLSERTPFISKQQSFSDSNYERLKPEHDRKDSSGKCEGLPPEISENNNKVDDELKSGSFNAENNVLNDGNEDGADTRCSVQIPDNEMKTLERKRFKQQSTLLISPKDASTDRSDSNDTVEMNPPESNGNEQRAENPTTMSSDSPSSPANSGGEFTSTRDGENAEATTRRKSKTVREDKMNLREKEEESETWTAKIRTAKKGIDLKKGVATRRLKSKGKLIDRESVNKLKSEKTVSAMSTTIDASLALQKRRRQTRRNTKQWKNSAEAELSSSSSNDSEEGKSSVAQSATRRRPRTRRIAGREKRVSTRPPVDPEGFENEDSASTIDSQDRPERSREVLTRKRTRQREREQQIKQPRDAPNLGRASSIPSTQQIVRIKTNTGLQEKTTTIPSTEAARPNRKISSEFRNEILASSPQRDCDNLAQREICSSGGNDINSATNSIRGAITSVDRISRTHNDMATTSESTAFAVSPKDNSPLVDADRSSIFGSDGSLSRGGEKAASTHDKDTSTSLTASLVGTDHTEVVSRQSFPKESRTVSGNDSNMRDDTVHDKDIPSLKKQVSPKLKELREEDLLNSDKSPATNDSVKPRQSGNDFKSIASDDNLDYADRPPPPMPRIERPLKATHIENQNQMSRVPSCERELCSSQPVALPSTFNPHCSNDSSCVRCNRIAKGELSSKMRPPLRCFICCATYHLECLSAGEQRMQSVKPRENITLDSAAVVALWQQCTFEDRSKNKAPRGRAGRVGANNTTAIRTPISDHSRYDADSSYTSRKRTKTFYSINNAKAAGFPYKKMKLGNRQGRKKGQRKLSSSALGESDDDFEVDEGLYSSDEMRGTRRRRPSVKTAHLGGTTRDALPYGDFEVFKEGLLDDFCVTDEADEDDVYGDPSYAHEIAQPSSQLDYYCATGVFPPKGRRNSAVAVKSKLPRQPRSLKAEWTPTGRSHETGYQAVRRHDRNRQYVLRNSSESDTSPRVYAEQSSYNRSTYVQPTVARGYGESRNNAPAPLSPVAPDKVEVAGNFTLKSSEVAEQRDAPPVAPTANTVYQTGVRLPNTETAFNRLPGGNLSSGCNNALTAYYSPDLGKRMRLLGWKNISMMLSTFRRTRGKVSNFTLLRQLKWLCDELGLTEAHLREIIDFLRRHERAFKWELNEVYPAYLREIFADVWKLPASETAEANQMALGTGTNHAGNRALRHREYSQDGLRSSIYSTKNLSRYDNNDVAEHLGRDISDHHRAQFSGSQQLTPSQHQNNVRHGSCDGTATECDVRESHQAVSINKSPLCHGEQYDVRNNGAVPFLRIVQKPRIIVDTESDLHKCNNVAILSDGNSEQSGNENNLAPAGQDICDSATHNSQLDTNSAEPNSANAAVSVAEGCIEFWACPQCLLCRYCSEPLRLAPKQKAPVSQHVHADGNDDSGIASSVICRDCGFAAHGACCFPPVPLLVAKWRCEKCTCCIGCGKTDVAPRDYSAWDVNFSLCVSCLARKEKGDFCMECGKVYDATGGTLVNGSIDHDVRENPVYPQTSGSSFVALETDVHLAQAPSDSSRIKCALCHGWVHGSCDPEAEKAIKNCSRNNGVADQPNSMRDDSDSPAFKQSAVEENTQENDVHNSDIESAKDELRDPEKACLVITASSEEAFSASSAISRACDAGDVESSSRHLEPFRCAVCRVDRITTNAQLLRSVDKLILLDRTKTFTYPVPYKFLSYWRVVKNPMNLMEMKLKILRKDYKKAEDMFADFALLLRNAKIAHMPNSRIYRLAEHMKRIGFNLLSRIFSLTEEDIEEAMRAAAALATVRPTHGPWLMTAQQCFDLESVVAETLRSATGDAEEVDDFSIEGTASGNDEPTPTGSNSRNIRGSKQREHAALLRERAARFYPNIPKLFRSWTAIAIQERFYYNAASGTSSLRSLSESSDAVVKQVYPGLKMVHDTQLSGSPMCLSIMKQQRVSNEILCSICQMALIKRRNSKRSSNAVVTPTRSMVVLLCTQCCSATHITCLGVADGIIEMYLNSASNPSPQHRIWVSEHWIVLPYNCNNCARCACCKKSCSEQCTAKAVGFEETILFSLPVIWQNEAKRHALQFSMFTISTHQRVGRRTAPVRCGTSTLCQNVCHLKCLWLESEENPLSSRDLRNKPLEHEKEAVQNNGYFAKCDDFSSEHTVAQNDTLRFRLKSASSSTETRSTPSKGAATTTKRQSVSLTNNDVIGVAVSRKESQNSALSDTTAQNSFIHAHTKDENPSAKSNSGTLRNLFESGGSPSASSQCESQNLPKIPSQTINAGALTSTVPKTESYEQQPFATRRGSSQYSAGNRQKSESHSLHNGHDGFQRWAESASKPSNSAAAAATYDWQAPNNDYRAETVYNNTEKRGNSLTMPDIDGSNTTVTAAAAPAVVNDAYPQPQMVLSPSHHQMPIGSNVDNNNMSAAVAYSNLGATNMMDYGMKLYAAAAAAAAAGFYNPYAAAAAAAAGTSFSNTSAVLTQAAAAAVAARHLQHYGLYASPSAMLLPYDARGVHQLAASNYAMSLTAAAAMTRPRSNTNYQGLSATGGMRSTYFPGSPWENAAAAMGDRYYGSTNSYTEFNGKNPSSYLDRRRHSNYGHTFSNGDAMHTVHHSRASDLANSGNPAGAALSSKRSSNNEWMKGRVALSPYWRISRFLPSIENVVVTYLEFPKWREQTSITTRHGNGNTHNILMQFTTTSTTVTSMSSGVVEILTGHHANQKRLKAPVPFDASTLGVRNALERTTRSCEFACDNCVAKNQVRSADDVREIKCFLNNYAREFADSVAESPQESLSGIRMPFWDVEKDRSPVLICNLCSSASRAWDFPDLATISAPLHTVPFVCLVCRKRNQNEGVDMPASPPRNVDQAITLLSSSIHDIRARLTRTKQFCSFLESLTVACWGTVRKSQLLKFMDSPASLIYKPLMLNGFEVLKFSDEGGLLMPRAARCGAEDFGLAENVPLFQLWFASYGQVREVNFHKSETDNSGSCEKILGSLLETCANITRLYYSTENADTLSDASSKDINWAEELKQIPDRYPRFWTDDKAADAVASAALSEDVPITTSWKSGSDSTDFSSTNFNSIYLAEIQFTMGLVQRFFQWQRSHAELGHSVDPLKKWQNKFFEVPKRVQQFLRTLAGLVANLPLYLQPGFDVVRMQRHILSHLPYHVGFNLGTVNGSQNEMCTLCHLPSSTVLGTVSKFTLCSGDVIFYHPECIRWSIILSGKEGAETNANGQTATPSSRLSQNTSHNVKADLYTASAKCSNVRSQCNDSMQETDIAEEEHEQQLVGCANIAVPVVGVTDVDWKPVVDTIYSRERVDVVPEEILILLMGNASSTKCRICNNNGATICCKECASRCKPETRNIVGDNQFVHLPCLLTTGVWDFTIANRRARCEQCSNNKSFDQNMSIEAFPIGLPLTFYCLTRVPVKVQKISDSLLKSTLFSTLGTLRTSNTSKKADSVLNGYNRPSHDAHKEIPFIERYLEIVHDEKPKLESLQEAYSRVIRIKRPSPVLRGMHEDVHEANSHVSPADQEYDVGMTERGAHGPLKIKTITHSNKLFHDKLMELLSWLPTDVTCSIQKTPWSKHLRAYRNFLAQLESIVQTSEAYAAFNGSDVLTVLSKGTSLALKGWQSNYLVSRVFYAPQLATGVDTTTAPDLSNNQRFEFPLATYFCVIGDGAGWDSYIYCPESVGSTSATSQSVAISSASAALPIDKESGCDISNAVNLIDENAAERISAPTQPLESSHETVQLPHVSTLGEESVETDNHATSAGGDSADTRHSGKCASPDEGGSHLEWSSESHASQLESLIPESIAGSRMILEFPKDPDSNNKEHSINDSCAIRAGQIPDPGLPHIETSVIPAPPAERIDLGGLSGRPARDLKEEPRNSFAALRADDITLSDLTLDESGPTRSGIENVGGNGSAVQTTFNWSQTSQEYMATNTSRNDPFLILWYPEGAPCEGEPQIAARGKTLQDCMSRFRQFLEKTKCNERRSHESTAASPAQSSSKETSHNNSYFSGLGETEEIQNLNFFGFASPEVKRHLDFECDVLLLRHVLSSEGPFTMENYRATPPRCRGFLYSGTELIRASDKRFPAREYGVPRHNLAYLSHNSVPATRVWADSMRVRGGVCTFEADNADFRMEYFQGTRDNEDPMAAFDIWPNGDGSGSSRSASNTATNVIGESWNTRLSSPVGLRHIEGLRTRSDRSAALRSAALAARIRFERMSQPQLYRHLVILNSRFDRRIEARMSSIHGLGLFAVMPIVKGEPVVEYIGDLIRDAIADKREKLYEAQGNSDAFCYMFRLDSNYVVDATTAGNVARYINHSCVPNCTCRVIVTDSESRHIVIFARQDIAAGEEITYDYKFNVEEEALKLVCKCGAASCLGRMN